MSSEETRLGKPKAGLALISVSRYLRGFRSLHPGGANFLFLDGTIRFLGEEIDRRTFAAMSTPNRQEAIESLQTGL